MNNNNNKQKKGNGLLTLIITVVCIYFGFNILNNFIENFRNNIDDPDNKYAYDESKFNLISSSENKILDGEIKSFAKKNGIDLNITYADTLDIMSKLNSGEKYDAVWSANSIWVYRVNTVSLSESKSMSINPVIFAIKKSKANELGFVGHDVKPKDILSAIRID